MEREEPVTIATLPNIVGLDKRFFFLSHTYYHSVKIEGKKYIPCKYVVAAKEEEDANC